MRVIDEELYRAIALKRTDEVRFLLERGADASAPGSEHESTLLLAVKKNEGDDTVCKMLIEAGADINAGDKYESVLYWAVQKNRYELARDLIARGAHVIPKDGKRNPIDSLYSDEQLTVAQLLIVSGADPKHGQWASGLLSRMAHAGAAKLCSFFLDSGLLAVHDDPDALLQAAEAGRLEACRVLVAHGMASSMTPVAPDPAYLTPFQVAVSGGHTEVAKYFIDECAEDPAQRTLSGKTMVQLTKSKEMRDLLRAAKADISIRGAVGPAREAMPLAARGARVGSAL
jgi:ankyrin repeat protein